MGEEVCGECECVCVCLKKKSSAAHSFLPKTRLWGGEKEADSPCLMMGMPGSTRGAKKAMVRGHFAG